MTNQLDSTDLAAGRFARWAWPILLCAILAAPAWIWFGEHAYDRNNNNVEQWLPQGFEATDVYRDFRELFGSDEFMLVSWPGCTLDDPRLERLATVLENELEAEQARLFDRVATGQRVFNQLMSDPIDLSRASALRRLRGILVGTDMQTTCAVITLSDEGDNDRRRVIDVVTEAAVGCGVPEQEIRLSGDAVISAAIDIESNKAIDRWIPMSAILAVLVAWTSLRSVRLAIVVFAVSRYCAAVSEAVIYLTGGSMNLLVVMVPVLVYVLTLSASVHLTNYFRDAQSEGAGAEAPMRAIRAGWQPCFIAALTTALGLASLAVSRVVPVRTFGSYSAWGILISFLVTLLVLPAALSKFAPAPSQRRQVPGGRPMLRAFGLQVVRFRWAIIGVFVIVILFFSYGATQLKPSVQPKRFLAAQSRWIQDAEWFAEHVGPLAQIEIVIGFHESNELNLLQRMRVVRDIHSQIALMDEIGGTLSAATFAPSLGEFTREPEGVPGKLLQFMLNRSLDENRSLFIDGRFLAEQEGWQLWRVTARAAQFDDSTYHQLLEDVGQRVGQTVDALEVRSEDLAYYQTGAVPMVYEAQRELLQTLALSFVLAFVMISLVVVVVLRDVVLGLVAMLPNVFPALAIFGAMGWSGTAVDVGAMMTASVALGIAVDDSMHFLTWHRRALARGRTTAEAICEAYSKCAAAMTQTSLIAGVGLVVFAMSAFRPVAQFGVLMFGLLMAALIGDLLLLPALLAVRKDPPAPSPRSGRPAVDPAPAAEENS